jgi:SnoaL-like domain
MLRHVKAGIRKAPVIASLSAWVIGVLAGTSMAVVVGVNAGVSLQSLEFLSAKDAIREKVALYSLLHDGDGVVQDGRRWADALWTTDASFQVIYPGGKRVLGNGGNGLKGRETIFRAFGGPLPMETDSAIRHVLMEPVFDFVTARTAGTRTAEIVIRGRKLRSSLAAATEVQGPVDSYVMHDTWEKGDDGQWRKSRSMVYCTVACPELLPPAMK